MEYEEDQAAVQYLPQLRMISGTPKALDFVNASTLWPEWLQWFRRFRNISGLGAQPKAMQKDILLHFLGPESENAYERCFFKMVNTYERLITSLLHYVLPFTVWHLGADLMNTLHKWTWWETGFCVQRAICPSVLNYSYHKHLSKRLTD